LLVVLLGLTKLQRIIGFLFRERGSIVDLGMWYGEKKGRGYGYVGIMIERFGVDIWYII